MKIISLALIIISLQGCGGLLPKIGSFEMDACIVHYCETTEYNLKKRVGLKIIEYALNSQGIRLSLGKGICKNYYEKRTIDYRFLLKSAKDICYGDR